MLNYSSAAIPVVRALKVKGYTFKEQEVMKVIPLCENGLNIIVYLHNLKEKKTGTQH